MQGRRLLTPAPVAARAGGLLRGAVHDLLRSWPGRVLLVALAVRALSLAGLPAPALVAGTAELVLVLWGVYAAVRLLRWLFRGVLWRIRTKLILSYLFIAVVPVVLLAAFFLLAMLIGMILVTSYMVSAHIESDAEEL